MSSLSRGTLPAIDKDGSTPAELFETAQKYLRINIKELRDVFVSGKTQELLAKAVSPKEEFLLKTLLKRAVSAAEPSHNDVSQPGPARDLVLSENFWTLIIYLFQSIRDESLALTLNEKGFMLTLDQSLTIISQEIRNLLSAPQTPPDPSMYTEDQDESPCKKRKLATEPQANGHPSKGPSAIEHLQHLVVLVSKAAASLTESVQTKDKADSMFWSPVMIALSIEVDSAASLVGKMLEVVAATLATDVECQHHPALLSIIDSGLWIWQHSVNEVAGSKPVNIDQLFTTNCLGWCLIILHLTSGTNHDSPDTFRMQRSLRSLTFKHSIGPTRKLFITDIANTWGSISHRIGWSKIEPVYSLLGPFFSHTLGLASRLALTETCDLLQDFISEVFDVAVRSVPSPANRRSSENQAWLEALFSACMHIVCPSLHKMELNRNGLSDLTPQIHAETRTSLRSLDVLLDIVSVQKLVISLPVVAYFCSALIASSPANPQWALLARLLDLDINVLVPNSGLLSARSFLSEVCQHITASEEATSIDYETVRDGIISPLMSGQAQARDMQGFVGLWIENLDLAMYERASEDYQPDKVHLALVWEDPDLFSHFRDLIKSLPSTSFVQPLLAELLERLERLGRRVGPTVDIFSRLAIVDALLEARTEEVTFDLQILQRLTAAVSAALDRQSDYQLQRWRLWAFLRRVETVSPRGWISTSLPKVALSSVMDINAKATGFRRAARLRDILECFHLNVVTHVLTKTLAHDELSNQLANLSQLVSTQSWLQNDDSEPTVPCLWNGRTETLQNIEDLVNSCLCVLMQNPKALQLDPQATDGLLKALLTTSHEFLRWTTGDRMLSKVSPTFTSLDEISSSPHFSKQQSKLTEVALNDAELPATLKDQILLALSFESMKKSQAERLASQIVDSFQGHKNDGTQVASPSCRLAVLDRLTSMASVSVGKPQNWEQLVEICTALQPDIETHSYEARQSIECSLERICATLVFRTMEANTTDAIEKVRGAMWSWCQSRLRGESQLDPESLESLLLGRILEAFWRHRKASPSTIAEEDLLKMGEKYVEILLHAVETLVASADSSSKFQESLPKLVQRLTLCEALCNRNTTFCESVHSLELALQARADSGGESSGRELASRTQDARIQLRQLAYKRTIQLILTGDLKEELELLATSSLDQVLPPSKAEVGIYAARASSFVASMDPSNYHLLIRILEDDLQQGRRRFEVLLVIASMIKRTSDLQFNNLLELAEELRKVASGHLIMKVTDAHSLCAALECTLMVLERHTKLVNQAAIDQLLGELASIAANRQTIINSGVDYGSAIFRRTCDLVGVMLSQHRKRLGGRLHMLRPLIQGLLRCLFYSGSDQASTQLQTKQQIRFLQTLPSWLIDSSDSLTPASAEQLTRLITSICDPAPSAIRKSKNAIGNELTDHTKKARTIAGQHMQYLISEYTKCSLNGRIKPEMKEKLMPGLYAVLDVMDRDLMRAMNAAMDSSSRAIFKTLYDDYQRHGKWNQR